MADHGEKIGMNDRIQQNWYELQLIGGVYNTVSGCYECPQVETKFEHHSALQLFFAADPQFSTIKIIWPII